MRRRWAEPLDPRPPARVSSREPRRPRQASRLPPAGCFPGGPADGAALTDFGGVRGRSSSDSAPSLHDEPWWCRSADTPGIGRTTRLRAVSTLGRRTDRHVARAFGCVPRASAAPSSPGGCPACRRFCGGRARSATGIVRGSPTRQRDVRTGTPPMSSPASRHVGGVGAPTRVGVWFGDGGHVVLLSTACGAVVGYLRHTVREASRCVSHVR